VIPALLVAAAGRHDVMWWAAETSFARLVLSVIAVHPNKEMGGNESRVSNPATAATTAPRRDRRLYLVLADGFFSR